MCESHLHSTSPPTPSNLLPQKVIIATPSTNLDYTLGPEPGPRGGGGGGRRSPPRRPMHSNESPHTNMRNDHVYYLTLGANSKIECPTMQGEDFSGPVLQVQLTAGASLPGHRGHKLHQFLHQK
jgi:hypothetical protein